MILRSDSLFPCRRIYRMAFRIKLPPIPIRILLSWWPDLYSIGVSCGTRRLAYCSASILTWTAHVPWWHHIATPFQSYSLFGPKPNRPGRPRSECSLVDLIQFIKVDRIESALRRLSRLASLGKKFNGARLPLFTLKQSRLRIDLDGAEKEGGYFSLACRTTHLVLPAPIPTYS